KKTVPGKKNVEIVGVEPVGNYAVKLVFDDMHDTGIFTWVYFKELGEDFDKLWGGYLDALDAANLSREPMIGLGEPSGSGGGCGSGSCGCGH
ncbi:MAG TPA: gamma-butyrobetaine hydroxylase-like domain-containing protein, partial [Kaistiaceae bacterium]|nr:gamma-butyrobetaine hydroxylase-like domain-containing protein [Kaistiaceae bacterium]